MILILSDAFDTHADAVEDKIKALGAIPFRLNLNVEALLDTKIKIAETGWIFEQNGIAISSQDVEAIWARRLSVSQTLQEREVQDINGRSGRRLWISEWNRSLYGAYVALRDRFWMNPIQASALADNKIYQAKIARSCNLDVPEFVVSNCREDLEEFIGKCEKAALKFMSQDMYRGDDGEFKGIYVNKISRGDLSLFGGREENPVTLQVYIEKLFEVRYTVIGDEHFACAIDSQSSQRASVDWRRYDVPNTPHRVIQPPPQIKARVTALMEALGLVYGALDFIVDVHEKWWFLEVNTAGQWLWIEDLVGLPISSTVARSLVEHGRRGSAR